MSFYVAKNEKADGKRIILDDMILTSDLPTAAGSKMLEGYMSLFDAEVVERLKKAGYSIAGKANVGEFAIDVLGETSAFGASLDGESNLVSASSKLLADGEGTAAIGLDANGTPRRAAAVSGQVCVKATYGTISRFGTISVACSGETVSVTANTVDACKEVLGVIVGHDDKDGTSLSDELCSKVMGGGSVSNIKRVALAKGITETADDDVKAKIADSKAKLEEKGIEVVEIDDSVLFAANAAWNVLMSAELCNNVSRYDGVKYGYRTKNYTTIDELYTNSRTEAFGELLKNAILFGSETLSTENYMKVYDKSLRIRRVICEKFDEIFAEFDAVLMPASKKYVYKLDDVKANKYMAYDENLYTAPASITGLPAVVAGGVQLIGKAFSEAMLFDAAKSFEEGK